MNYQTVHGKKRIWVFSLIGVILLLAGSVFGVDWANYILGTNLLYPAIGKPMITLLATILVIGIGENRINSRDWALLLAAFCCMVPTDILMSVVAVNPSVGVSSPVFMVGGILSILAHLFLIVRLARFGAPGWKRRLPLGQKLGLPILIFGIAAFLLGLLWPHLVRIGHALIAPIYTLFFCTTMWLAWETVRWRLLPKPNGWMAALAATGWFLTEITGEIYNLALGPISEVMFRIVWVFYGTTVVLWALSGYRWVEEPRRAKKPPARSK